jgi:ABC-type multidrug transport system fused ATPase/permease subunit
VQNEQKLLSLLWRSVGYLRPYKKLAAVTVALVVCGALVNVLLPWPLKYIFDNVLGNQPLSPWLATLFGLSPANRQGLLLFFVFAGLFLVLLQHAITILESYLHTTIDQKMTLDLRSQMFRHVQSLSMAAHDRRRSGMLIYRINNMCDAAPRLLMSIPHLAQSLLTLAGMFWVALFLSPTLALLSMAVVPFLYCSTGYYIKIVQPRLYRVKGLEGQSLSIVHEAMSMIRVIIAFGRESYEYHRFRTQAEKATHARIRLTVLQTLFSLGVNTITALGSALVLGFGANQVFQGRITAGTLLVLLAYIAAVYKPLETISTTIGGLQDVLISLKIAFRLLDTVPDIQDDPEAIAIQRAQGRITYQGVHFRYTGRRDTLRNINFEIQPGQVVAIVGPTGAGKTTLVSLLPRFYEVVRGSIQIDGIDIRKLKLQSLREQISIVLQEPLLFSGTIADNIRYGRLEATQEEIIAAATAANAHDFITRLPQGYQTELGERGAKLSCGERQRIAVARAFVKNAPILILDEPTSSIDSRTEAVILDALERLMEGRTTFMIAHRLSTIRKADLILVLNQSRLVQHGTHEELLRRGGLYKQLHQMQTKHVGRNHGIHGIHGKDQAPLMRDGRAARRPSAGTEEV